MHRLEDSHLIPDIRRRREAQPAHQRRGQVADDIAVHVGGDNHLELFGALDQLVGAVVNNDVVRLNIGIFGGNLFEGALQHPLGELHDVGFGGAVNLFAPLGARQLKREAHNLLAPLARDELERLRHARGLHMLDTCIEVFHILAHHHEVNPASAVRGGHIRELAHGAHIRVGLKQLAQSHIRALLAIAHWSLQRTFQHHARLANRLDGFLRYARFNSFFENAGACLAHFPLQRGAHRLQNS
ncbi:hypothetical protein HRbin14_02293 [bacterium HR14]|nr:hypothetical protein HRbin14_02293 [bacterium HR14]